MSKEVQMTMKGAIVTVFSVEDESLNETSIVKKMEHFCDCNNCNKFEIYVILDK